MVVYDKTFQLGAGQGESGQASRQYIIIHDTANDDNQGDNSAYNEASYMHNNWQNAYTHAIAGWDKVYIVGEPGYIAYGAGSPANERSPFQIELAHYSDPTKQKQSYANYINAVREYANIFNIPLTLDGAGNGVKSHKWVSDNLWGDHQDPYAYLTRIGISKDQLAKDLANGIGGASESNQSNNNDSTSEINKTPNMEEKEMTYLIFAKDTKRWYITNGIEIRYIKTERVLGNYQNQWLKFNLPVDTMFQGEVDKEFGTGATDPNRDISKG